MKKLLLFIGIGLLAIVTTNGQITKNASEYGLAESGSRTANLQALQNAFNDHLAGNLDVLRINNGTFNVNGSVQIAGWDGLKIIGNNNTTISTNANQSIFISRINNDPVRNGTIKDLKLESTWQGAQNFGNNPGLFFLGNISFRDFVFDTVEFTASTANINGIYIGNGFGSTNITQEISITNCNFHDLGRMGMEFFNEPSSTSDLTPRFKNISVTNSSFEKLGKLFDNIGRSHGIAISFGGWGSNHNVSGNTFGAEIPITNIESAGVDNLTIANNLHLGSNGAMYQFNTYLSTNATITNDQAFDYYFKPTLFSYVNNLTVENSKLFGGVNFGNPIDTTTASDVWFKNSTIINNVDVTGAYGAIAFYGQPGTVNNINFEDSYIGELATSQPQNPVIFTQGSNISNINFTDTCLFHFGNMYTVAQGSGAGLNLGNYTTDCADVFFPPTVNDEIVSVDASKNLIRGSDTVISIAYSAKEPSDIHVLFKSTSAPYTTYQSKLVNVTAGSNTTDVTIAIPFNTPVADNSYRYQILLLPRGLQGWNNRLDAAYVGGISVADGASPITGEILTVDAPKNVVRGTSVNVSVAYSASEAIDVSVALKLGSPYASYRGILSVPAGSGTAEVEVEVPATAVLGFETYRYQILLLPPGQLAYSARFDEAYVGKVSVTNQGTSLKANLDFLSATNNELETLSVYPNPAIDQTMVHIPIEESYSSFALYTINGTMVKEGDIDRNQKELPITFSGVEKGLYILRLSNSKGEEVFKKIVKE